MCSWSLAIIVAVLCCVGVYGSVQSVRYDIGEIEERKGKDCNVGCVSIWSTGKRTDKARTRKHLSAKCTGQPRSQSSRAEKGTKDTMTERSGKGKSNRIHGCSTFVGCNVGRGGEKCKKELHSLAETGFDPVSSGL